MLCDFVQMFFNLLTMLLKQLHTRRDSLITLAEELSIELNIAYVHTSCPQTLNELNPGNLIPGIVTIAICIIPPNALLHESDTFVITECMSAESGLLHHLLDRQ